MRNLVVSMLAPALASILGCVDATPSDFTVPDAGAGGGHADVDYGDLPPDAIPPDPYEICRSCFRAPEDPGPGCAGAYETCNADDRCGLIMECALVTDCLSKPTQGEAIICSIPCFTSHGVSDPVTMLTQPMFTCALGVCLPACGVMP
jgi:hypothetical protein